MSQPMNPYDEAPQQPPGMSGTTKVLLTLGIGCGVFLLLCCGVFGLGGYFMGRSLQNAISEDPIKVREATEQIVDIQVPEDLPPKMTFDMRIPFVDKRVILVVAYGDANEENSLVLAEFNPDIGSEEQMNKQMRDSMRQNRGKEAEEVEVSQSESIERDINGKPATLRLSQGKGEKSGDAYWQLEGTFTGKQGPAILFLKLKDPPHNKDDVMRILDTLK